MLEHTRGVLFLQSLPTLQKCEVDLTRELWSDCMRTLCAITLAYWLGILGVYRSMYTCNAIDHRSMSVELYSKMSWSWTVFSVAGLEESRSWQACSLKFEVRGVMIQSISLKTVLSKVMILLRGACESIATGTLKDWWLCRQYWNTGSSLLHYHRLSWTYFDTAKCWQPNHTFHGFLSIFNLTFLWSILGLQLQFGRILLQHYTWAKKTCGCLIVLSFIFCVLTSNEETKIHWQDGSS